MRLRFPQLAAHLTQDVAPVYLLCGDEPLQLREATVALRQAARAAGYDERLILDQDALADRGRLAAATETLSLFATRRLIELRITAARLGRDGGAAVRDYCDRPPCEDRLLIVAPMLERKELKSAWVQAVDRLGVVLQVWPLRGTALIAWLEERLRRRGLQSAPGVAAQLAERSEGNMLAADQEVEKLALIHGGGTLGETELLAAIGDSARFDPFALSSAALVGDRRRVDRILGVLLADGTAEALILWALARDIRMLAAVAFAQAGGKDPAPIFTAHQAWEARRTQASQALRRHSLDGLQRLLQLCAEADARIKGMAGGDPWPVIRSIADGLASNARRLG